MRSDHLKREMHTQPAVARRSSGLARCVGLWIFLLAGWLHVSSAIAASGSYATTGTYAQSLWWLDLSGYNDNQAQNGGQSFTFALPNVAGTLSFSLTTTPSGNNGSALAAVAEPAWTGGGAFGNPFGSYNGIAGLPILYWLNQPDGSVNISLSGIQVTDSAGNPRNFQFIAADGENTNDGESISYNVSPGVLSLLQMVNYSGSSNPTLAGTGTGSVTETCTGCGGYASAPILATLNPTSATFSLTNNEAVILGLALPQITLVKQVPSRVASSDQFNIQVAYTAPTLAISSATTTGTGTTVSTGPTAVLPGNLVTLRETMVAGSASALSYYNASISCTNSGPGAASFGGTNTVLPSGAGPNWTLTPQAGDSITCTITNTPKTQNVAGTVYGDANHNANLDGGEVGTGVTGLFVKLAPFMGGTCQSPATTAAAVSATTGAYSLPNVAPGAYCLILDGNSTLSDVTPALPSGWIGTQNPSGVISLTVATSPPAPQNFGLYQGMSFSGTVFADTGTGGGTANNGVLDGGETGIAGVSVNALSGSSTVAAAVTSGSGSYTLWLPGSVTGSVVITPAPPSGYLATGGSAGSSGGSYSRPSVTATTSAGLLAANVNFGLVPPNTLAPDGSQSASPGTVLFYAHRFVPASAGQLTFSSAATAAPALSGWVETLYRDVNCNGQLDSGDTLLTAAVAATAGQPVCVLVKEFVPANAPINAQNQVALSAAFSYTNAAPALAATLTRTDTTTVSLSGGVLLSKLVSNVTRGGAAGTSNNAAPGDTLQYQLVLSNPGSAAVGQLVVTDATPAFTRFVSAACPASASLPAGLTACSVSTQPAVGAQGAVAWSFTGKLAPGATVSVSYQVTVSP